MSSIKELVLHTPDPKAPPHIPLFLPKICISSTNANANANANTASEQQQQQIRPLHSLEDLPRIMDFPNMSDPPPKDTTVMHCEASSSSMEENKDDDDDDAGIVFPKRCAKLAGGYIFLSRLLDDATAAGTATGTTTGTGNNANNSSSNNNTNAAAAKNNGGGGATTTPTTTTKSTTTATTTNGGKVYCIPLVGSTVEFPPGGRRVFREHAHTGARAGYEMAIHVKLLDTTTTGGENVMTNNGGSGSGGAKIKCYIVFDSLKLRETWANAIKARCDVGKKPTVLRAAGSRFDDVGGGIGRGGGGRMGLDVMGGVMGNQPTGIGGLGGVGIGGPKTKAKKNWGKLKGMVSIQAAFKQQHEADPDLDAAVKSFGKGGFNEEEYVDKFLMRNSVDDLSTECDKLEKWMDVIKHGLRGAVLEQYEYFVEASREMSTMGREVAWLRTLVERQQETLMTMKNIDFGAGLEEIEEGGPEDDAFGYVDDEEGLLTGGIGGYDAGSDASSVISSSSEESGSNTSLSKTPMRANRKKDLKKRGGGGKTSSSALATMAEDSATSPEAGAESQLPGSNYIEIPPWIIDATEEVSAFIKESRYTDATELILKAKAEVGDILAAHEQPTPPVVTTPKNLRSSNNGKNDGKNDANPSTSSPPAPPKKLHKKHQALLQRTNLQLDALMDRMSKRLAENLRRKNEALKASAKRERADPLSTLAPLASPVCLNDDAVALNLLVKLGKHQEAATAYAARRSLLLSECLHERPISSPVGMDAVIYAAQLSSSFFSALAMAVDGFLDLFDSDSGKGGGADDETSLNSRSIFLMGGGKRVPSGALSAVVLWCDSELAKFSNVFGSSRLLGSLSLSPFSSRRQEEKAEDKSYEVAAKCVDQAFLFASDNLDSIGLPLTPKLAELIRPRLKGCEADVAALMDPRWKPLTFEWTMESNSVDRRIVSRPNITSRTPVALDDRRV